MWKDDTLFEQDSPVKLLNSKTTEKTEIWNAIKQTTKFLSAELSCRRNLLNERECFLFKKKSTMEQQYDINTKFESWKISNGL